METRPDKDRRDMRLIIVSGLAGSGKTVALNMLEDLGFYCIDNVPAALLSSMIGWIVESGERTYRNLAVGIDARNTSTELDALPNLMRGLQQRGVACEVLFLNADDEILLKRFGETRRKHPLASSGDDLREAIAKERELLGPVIYSADLVVDTTRTSVHELRDIIRNRISARAAPGLSVLIQSFGYKHGIPSDADFVFDLRCLPNPYWQSHLRPLTGLDQPILEFLDGQQRVQKMFQEIFQFLENWIPEYEDFNRNYLTVALGCTGGQHRSVYMAEKLAAALAQKHPHVTTRHNELPSQAASSIRIASP